jgi:hypothetical protein
VSDARGVVDRIQHHLEAIYDLQVQARASAFLVGDAHLDALVEEGAAPAEARGSGEHVLVRREGDDLHIALYLGDEVQRALVEGPCLQDHCHATEGVSHVVFLLWCAQEGRTVRPFDLELQAEVDKAATCLLLAHQEGRRRGASLLDRLSLVEWRVDLDAEARERYRTSHRLGLRYAQRLHVLLERGVGAMLAELRTFYRLPGEDRARRAAA